MPSPASFPAAKSAAVALHAAAKTLDAAIAADVRSIALPGHAQYPAAEIGESLRRAEALLAKDHYKLCFAGGFSAGKSTTINALLGEPDLLPTAAGECTLAITIMTGPYGGRECVRVKYFPREVAIKNVVYHQKRYRNAFKQLEAKLKGAGADQMVAVVEEVIAWLPKVHTDQSLPEALRKEFDKAKAERYAGELSEFLSYLAKFAARCGTLVEDELANRSFYLTYDDKQGGLGHLFMVDQVFIHKRNVLFEEKAIQIVDLPGIDSTNSYARQVTLDYLTEADLVINVLPPQGFTMSYIDIINEVGAANRGNIANKMFYVINRFDSNEDRNFSKKELESLLRDQIAAEIDKNGLNSKNLFATCALIDIYRLRGKTESYDAMLRANQNKLTMMAGTDEPWAGIARDALNGNGVTKVREAILVYLEQQLAFERLRDVELAVRSALDGADQLLGRNGGLLQAARASGTTRVTRIRDFLEKAVQQFDGQILGLAHALPGMVAQVVQTQLKQQVATVLGNLRKIPLADPTKQIAFTGQAARLTTPTAIKQHWIDWAKIAFSDRFVETACQVLIGNVQNLVDGQVKAAKLDAILDAIANAAGREVGASLRAAVDDARRNIEVLTRLRASEETWPLRAQPIHPQGFEAAWTPQIEEAFKTDLIGNLTKVFNTACDRLGAVLGQYYQVVLQDLAKQARAGTDELENALMSRSDLELPTDLVAGEAPDPDEAKKRRLAAYDGLLGKARAARDALAPLVA